MKKVTLSMIAALAMSTFAVAGGDIAPVEPAVEVPEVVSTPGAFYVSIGYGMVNTEADFSADIGDNIIATASYELDHSTVMFQAGYQFNPYIAIKGRYWTAVGDADITGSLTVDGELVDSIDESINDDSNAWGIYVKPMYPVTSEFTVYGLLGYGNVKLDIPDIGQSLDESQFQWGLGASYAFNDNFSIFVDYVSMYDDSQSYEVENEVLNGDVKVDSWNFGVTYKF